MSIAKDISTKISTFQEDRPFGYVDLPINKQQYGAAAKALQRLQERGIIRKVSKGVYYKPKMTVFGALKPRTSDLLNLYLFEDGKRIAYLTGTYLYNQLGLTTQIPAVYRIASKDKRIYINQGVLQAKPVKSYLTVNNENYESLGFLDALKDFNNIPDLNRTTAVPILLKALEQRKEETLEELVKYSLSYPPRVRAFLGALLEELGKGSFLKQLKNNLNPLTIYKLNLEDTPLTTQKNWNIV